MKINVQEELKRFKPWVSGGSKPRAAESPSGYEAVMSQIRELKKADLKIVAEVRQLTAELKHLIQNQEAVGISRNITFQKWEDVCLCIYDHVQNQWKVAQANREETRAGICKEILEYLERLYASEFGWMPVKSLGEIYNPYDYEGFVTADRERYRGQNPQKLEIITELRTGFRCEEKLIRKPVVEFFE